MKGKIKTTLLITVLLISTLTIAIPFASAADEIWVDDDFTSATPGWEVTHWDEIQEGITAVDPEGTVYVAAGTYPENLVVGKALTLEGANVGVDPTGGGARDPESIIDSVTIEDDGVTIDGFEITGTGAVNFIDHDQQGATIFVDGKDDCVIQNNIISGDLNGVNLFGGNYYDPARYSDDNLVTRNKLTAGLGNYGVKAKGTGNTITDNELLDWNNAAIHIWTEEDEDYSPDYNEISRNTIDGGDVAEAEIGIWIRTGSHLTIEDNIIIGLDSAGIFITDNHETSTHPPTDITVSGNKITDIDGGGPHVWFEDATVTAVGVGIYVGTPWGDTGTPVVGNSFTDNDISSCDVGMIFLASADNEVHYNNLPEGLENNDALEVLDAEHNYWSTAYPDITVDYYPYLSNPIEDVNLDAEYYKTGDTVTANIRDPDLNVNPLVREIVAVTATSTTDPADITISLRETGVDTGIFKGTFKLVDATPGTGEVLVNEGDTVTVTYSGTDEATVDDTSPVATLTVPDAVPVGEVGFEVDFVAGENVELRVDLDPAEPGTWTASFRVDGLEIESVTSDTTYATTDWDTITYPDGTHTISVVVTDGAENSDSDSTDVEVDNTGPTVTDPTASPSIIGLDVSTEMVLTATVVDDGIGVDTVTVDCSDLGGASDVPMLDDGEGLDEEADDDIYTSALLTLSCDAEDVYELTITATDLLSNVNDLDFITVEVIDDIVGPSEVGFTEAVPVCGGLVVRGLYMEDDLTGPGKYEILVDDVHFDEITETELTSEIWMLTTSYGTFKRSVVLDLADYTGETVTITTVASDLVGIEADPIILYEGLIPDGEWCPVELYKGWNLVSLPLIPDSSDSGDVMSLILNQGASGVIVSYSYDQYTDAWNTNPAEMTDGYGYWLYALDDDVMIVEGVDKLGPPSPPANYEYTAGWVLAGYKSTTSMEIDDYIGSLEGASYFNTVYVWDATIPDWATLETGNTAELDPGMGFWIWMYEDQSLIPPIV